MNLIRYIMNSAFDILFVLFVASYQNFQLHAVIFIFLVIAFVLQIGFKIKIKKERITLIAILFFLNLNYFFVQILVDYEKSMSAIMTTIVFIFLMIRFPVTSSSKRYLGFILIAFIVLYIENQNSGQFSGLANNFGLLVASALVGYACTIAKPNKIFLIAGGLTTLLSLKRTAIFASASLLIYSIFVSKNYQKAWLIILSFVGFYLLYTILLYLYAGNLSLLLQRILDTRLSLESISYGSGRNEIYTEVISLLGQENFFRLLFFPTVSSEFYGANHAHNQFLEYILILGFWSAPFQILLFFQFAKYLYRNSVSSGLGYVSCAYFFACTIVAIPVIELHFLLPLFYFYSQRSNIMVSNEI